MIKKLHFYLFSSKWVVLQPFIQVFKFKNIIHSVSSFLRFTNSWLKGILLCMYRSEYLLWIYEDRLSKTAEVSLHRENILKNAKVVIIDRIFPKNVFPKLINTKQLKSKMPCCNQKMIEDEKKQDNKLTYPRLADDNNKLDTLVISDFRSAIELFFAITTCIDKQHV